VSSVWDAKQAAMSCHATQRSSTPMLSASEEQQCLFFGNEYFVKAASRFAGEDFMVEVLKDYLR